MAALALTGASAASASPGGGAGLAGGGASAGRASQTSAASTTEPSTAQPSFAGSTQAPGACTPTPSATATSGGAGFGGGGPNASTAALPCPHPTVPGYTAKIINGLAYAPANAPLQVQNAIWAGDRIRLKPYRIGGGHGKWKDSAYDCSGSVSYLLHAAGLLKISEDSGQMMSWGRRGAGQWITVYTNPGHAFIELAGIRLDTSAEQDPNPPSGSGPRWRPLMTSTSGYAARHPTGL